MRLLLLVAAAALAAVLPVGLAAAGTATQSKTNNGTGPAPKNTALPAVGGAAIVGQVLAASVGSWTGDPGSYAFQWQRCSSSSGCVDIAGAVASGYAAVSADVGEALRVVVTASNSHGSGSAASAQTAAVAAAPVLPVVAAPTNVVASDVGQTAVTVSWTGAAGAAGYNLYENGVRVGTASGSSTWVIFGAGSPLDCGTRYTFGIQAFDGLGGSSAVASTAASTLACSSLAGSAPANTAPPTVSGTATAGQTLTATSGSWSGSPSSYAYQWQRCASASSCSGIAGAAASSYTAVSADVGDTVRVVVTASNSAGSGSAASAQTAPVAAATTAGTGNVYVAAAGNDSTCARGDSSRPCVSFGRAYALAQPGDTILVAGGDYPAEQILKGSQPQSGPTISFRCAAGATCRVNGTLALGANNGSLSGDTPSYLSFDHIDVHGVLRTYYNQNSDPQPTHISFLNAHVWNLTNSGHLLEFVDDDSVLVHNLDIGPGCCNGDGLDFTIARPGAPSPSNITVDGVTIHDDFDSCSHLPNTITSQYGACSGSGYGDNPNGGYDHVDGSQWFGGRNVVWKNSRIYDINSGYPVGQGLFMQPANGGSFTNITIENSMFGNTPNNDVSFSGPGNGAFSGSLHLLYNTIQGNLRLYGDTNDEVFQAGTTIELTGNIATTIASSNNNSCSIYQTGNSLYTPTYSHNLFGNQTCSPTDIHANPTFVNPSPTNPDLDLAPGSPGINQADPTNYPSTDIHHTTRPLGNAPDIGADEAG